MKKETEIRIRDNNGGENRLQLKLIEELGEEGYVQQMYNFYKVNIIQKTLMMMINQI